MKKLSNNESKKISGGIKRTMIIQSIDEEFDGKYEEALKCYGATGSITLGNDLNEIIPLPWSKTASINWNNESWTPVYAHCGWHQADVIWKNSKGDYLVPTGIELKGMD